jgi:hypothetical protein
MVEIAMYQLCFYVPVDALDTVKQAVFAAGAGRIGNYDQCCWQVEGMGQFRPLPGAHPAIGEQGQLEKVREFRVEMVCDAAHIQAVVAALKQAHPYEEPAYNVTEILEF